MKWLKERFARPQNEANVLGAEGNVSMPDEDQLEVATFGAGCFWCLDAVARRIPGIYSSVTGYAGGAGPAPTYYDIHYSAASGSKFIEGVQLKFDPSQIAYDEILDLFFQSHDPTTPNQDGANVGPEYHSTIYYHGESQRMAASMAARQLSVKLGKPVITSILPFTTFYDAEPEHQNFYSENQRNPYCRIVIIPKLRKLGLE